MAKPFKKALTISTCLLVAVALTIGAVAWFAGVLNPGILGFQTGSNAALPDIQMWMYTSVEDLAAQGNPEGVETGWVESTPTIDGEDAYIIPAAPATTGDATDSGGEAYTKHTFVMNQLHFGVVDNLISLKDDNIIYLRLTVDAAKTGGDSMTFKISYVTQTEGVLTTDDLYNSIDLYDGDGKLADADTLSSKIKFDDCKPDETKVIPVDLTATTLNLAESARFLQIAAAVTTESKVIPGTEDFESLAFTDFALIGDTGSLNFAEKLGTAPTGTYYVYLKIAPNLDFFVYQEDLLDQFIPAHIFFDGKIELEMH